MLTREKTIENFKKASADFVGAKYILADKKISELLKIIASSKMLYELFRHVTENFDYATFKEVCFARSINGKGVFTMPARDEDALALIFLLLVEIDDKKTDLIKLLNDYFPSEGGKQSSYALFVTQAVIPFELLVEKYAYMLVNEQIDQDRNVETPQSQVEEKEAEEKEPAAVLESKEIKEASIYLSGEKNMIAANPKLNDEEASEIAFLLGELISALKENRERDIALSFIALKYAARANKKTGLDVDKITEVITKTQNRE